MELKVRYPVISKNDLKDIFNFIKKGSLKYARTEVSAIREFIGKLKATPDLGKPFEYRGLDLCLSVAFKNYLIIYKTDPENGFIAILTIHDHSRSFAKNLAIRDNE